MGSGTRVRDWATVDYYALLGIDPAADADSVTRAFREQAKRSHPDATSDAAAAARFSDVAAAYAVLGDRRMRLEYDRVRAEQGVRVAPPVAPTAGKVQTRAARKPWSARRALTVILAGVLVALLGIGAGLLTWTMHTHDDRQRARFVPVTASRINVSGSSIVSFLTRDGERIRVPEPLQHGNPSSGGLTANIRYDPANPEHVIVDSSNTGRDITFAIISLKFLVGGAVFTVLGWRRFRLATRAR